LNAAVQLIDVSKSFEDSQAVKSVSLDIKEGEFFSLLGPSGCGKTTLLRMIAGFERPTSGQVIVSGQEMSNVPPHKRPVNMVFQSYALFPHLTVYDNVAFGLRSTKSVAAAEIPGRVQDALTLVQLGQLSHRYPRELSGGQQQRIAFARAIVNKPSVLLLDEPLSALDARIREEMQEELARFKSKLAMTFVMVTHDQSEAFALSDRIAVFNGGRLEQLGTPQEIYENPSTKFVADFIGQTNLLEGKVVEVKAPYVKLALNDNFHVWAKTDEQFQEGETATVWIRTESVGLLDTASSQENFNNIFEAVVVHRSYQGASSEYRIEIGGITLHALQKNQSGGDYNTGSRIFAQLAANNVRLLSHSQNGSRKS